MPVMASPCLCDDGWDWNPECCQEHDAMRNGVHDRGVPHKANDAVQCAPYRSYPQNQLCEKVIHRFSLRLMGGMKSLIYWGSAMSRYLVMHIFRHNYPHLSTIWLLYPHFLSGCMLLCRDKDNVGLDYCFQDPRLRLWKTDMNRQPTVCAR